MAGECKIDYLVLWGCNPRQYLLVESYVYCLAPEAPQKRDAVGKSIFYTYGIRDSIHMCLPT